MPIIFVTLSDGCYKDRWSSEMVTLLKTDDRAGFRELIWEGQKSGNRDHFVENGTLVAVRPNKKARYFDIVGSVAEIERVREGSSGNPAEYKVLVDMHTAPRRIYKADDDRFVHNSVLRELGMPIETGAMPHGIYA